MAYAVGYEYFADKIGDDGAKLIYEFLLPERIRMSWAAIRTEISCRMKRCGECQKILSKAERMYVSCCDNCELAVCEDCYDKFDTGGYLDICDVCIQHYDPNLPWVLERKKYSRS